MNPTHPSAQSFEQAPVPIPPDEGNPQPGVIRRITGSRWWPRVEPYLYLAPVFIGIVLLTGGAIVASFVVSFTEWDLVGTPSWVGLKNYAEMWSSSLFRTVFANTFYYVLLAVPLSRWLDHLPLHC